MTLDIALRVALGSGVIFFYQVWPSTSHACLNYSAFWCWYVVTGTWLMDGRTDKRTIALRAMRTRC